MRTIHDDTRTRAPTGSYSARVGREHLAPLWGFFGEWFTHEPRAAAVPHLWRYDALRPLLLEAATVIGTEEAERRVLALENPGLPRRRLVTDALYAGLQLIVPGEHARSHRHSAAALRFVVEGAGSYTSVEGERAYMSPGDMIVTPSWTWHEHANECSEPTIWMDVLDVPLVRFLVAGFSEQYREARFPERRPPGDSLYRYAMNMRPVEARSESGAPSVFSYPYARTREVLARSVLGAAPDPHHGYKMEYIDPATGGPAIPTISTFMQLVPLGFTTKPYRSTAGTVYAVVEGHGRVIVGRGDEQLVLEYGPRDVWALPSWHLVAIEAAEESVIFSASDEAVHRKLGLFREERAAE